MEQFENNFGIAAYVARVHFPFFFFSFFFFLYLFFCIGDYRHAVCYSVYVSTKSSTLTSSFV
jgi:hypothetical protein